MKKEYSDRDPEVRKIIQNRILLRISDLGTSKEAVSRKSGHSNKFIRDFFKNADSWPHEMNMRSLADALECDFDYLLGNQEEIRLAEIINNKKAIPLYRPQSSGANGLFILGDAETLIPFDITFSLAVVVPDNSNAPRFRTEETVYTDEARRPAPGAYVFILFEDGSATIGLVEDIDARFVTLSGVAGRLDREKVKILQRIVAVTER